MAETLTRAERDAVDRALDAFVATSPDDELAPALRRARKKLLGLPPSPGEGRTPREWTGRTRPVREDLAKWLWERYAGAHAGREKTAGTWEAASERQPWIDDAAALAELLPSSPDEGERGAGRDPVVWALVHEAHRADVPVQVLTGLGPRVAATGYIVEVWTNETDSGFKVQAAGGKARAVFRWEQVVEVRLAPTPPAAAPDEDGAREALWAWRFRDPLGDRERRLAELLARYDTTLGEKAELREEVIDAARDMLNADLLAAFAPSSGDREREALSVRDMIALALYIDHDTIVDHDALSDAFDGHSCSHLYDAGLLLVQQIPSGEYVDSITDAGLRAFADAYAKLPPSPPSPSPTGGERDPWPGITRPASRAHMDLTKAVVVALEAGLEPATIRRFVEDELPSAPTGGEAAGDANYAPGIDELQYPVSYSSDPAELRRENAGLRARLRERNDECQRWAERWATKELGADPALPLSTHDRDCSAPAPSDGREAREFWLSRVGEGWSWHLHETEPALRELVLRDSEVIRVREVLSETDTPTEGGDDGDR